MSIANLAQVPVVTDIAWNKSQFDKAGNVMHKWGEVNHKLQKQDRDLLGHQVVEAYSQMRVEEYVNFSKTFTPYMRWELKRQEAFAPANQKVCNQATATECLNTWFLGGMREDQKPSLELCFRYAGCASNWMDDSSDEKKALKTEFKDSVNRIGNAYKGYHEIFYGDLKVAWKAHQQRVANMHKVFGEYFVKATSDLGCNEECVNAAISNKYKNFSEIMPKCECGAGAWKVRTTQVNVLAVTERVYGDLESLNELDSSSIKSAFIRLDM